MAIPDVQDFLAAFPGWATLTPFYGDETSGQASGQIIVKEMRPMLWQLDAKSATLKPSLIRYWKAKLTSLQNGKKLFYGFDKSCFYPGAYPNGTWPTGGSFDGVSAGVQEIPDNNSLKLKLLPVGYTGSPGDMVSVTVNTDPLTIALHMALESFTANGSGVTDAFAVEPPIRTGMAISNVVAVKRPACKMMIIPGSISYPKADAYGSISFSGIQVI
jgi:hypothetical protein